MCPFKIFAIVRVSEMLNLSYEQAWGDWERGRRREALQSFIQRHREWILYEKWWQEENAFPMTHPSQIRNIIVRKDVYANSVIWKCKRRSRKGKTERSSSDRASYRNALREMMTREGRINSLISHPVLLQIPRKRTQLTYLVDLGWRFTAMELSPD